MSTIEETTKKMLVLKTSDHQEFTLEKSAAMQSITIKNMLEDLDDENAPTMFIPLPNVDSRTLTKVIEYLKMHDHDDAYTENEELKQLDKALFDGVPTMEICYVIQAANYLNISGLINISCEIVVDHIKSKSPAYVRKLFNIVEELFSKEEEEAMMEKDHWAFEDEDSYDDAKIGLASFIDLDA